MKAKWYQLDERTWVLKNGTRIYGSVCHMLHGLYPYAGGWGGRTVGCYRTKLGAMRGVRHQVRLQDRLARISI